MPAIQSESLTTTFLPLTPFAALLTLFDDVTRPQEDGKIYGPLAKIGRELAELRYQSEAGYSRVKSWHRLDPTISHELLMSGLLDHVSGEHGCVFEIIRPIHPPLRH